MLDAPRILLGLAIVILLILMVASQSFDTTWSTPEAHATLATMEVGGARAVDDGKHWIFGLVFGFAILGSLVAVLSLATGPPQYARQRQLAVLLGGVAYLAVFAVLMFRYREFVEQGPTMAGPFATPTTWMVFGLWSVPTVFVVIYMIRFDTWFAEDSIDDEGESSC